ncbi:MAG: hypothetical protein P4L73_19735 [Caulobacteraceae bacterium]|nr:hypothetical protein [Caulobacteraceae bacterium]
MADPTKAPASAPVAAPKRRRAPVELNVIALVLVGVLTLAELAAVTFWGVQIGIATAIAGNAITGLFAVINRSHP